MGALAIVASLWWAAPGAAEIVGRPRVIDADTLDFSGQIVRLFGIDAPEVGQTCRAAGRVWPCGMEARWAAINRVSPHWVTCVEKARHRDRSVTAVCYLAGIGQHELNAWLVAQGWALADRAAAEDYVAGEEAARAARKGLWKGEFVPPWAWRQGRRLAPE
ncbi:MAG: thermonuclease family protein [Kiloniellaceae bacterium]